MRRLFAAFFLLPSLVVSGKDDAPPPAGVALPGPSSGAKSGDARDSLVFEPAGPFRLVDGRVFWLPDDKGNPPRFVWSGVSVAADEISFDRKTGSANATGHVTVDAGRLRIVADEVAYSQSGTYRT